MRTARAERPVALDPDAALALWTDVRRWPAFVEGLERVVEVSPEWPAEGSTVVWESGAGGRGRVTERVTAGGDGRFATEVLEDALHGAQTLTFAPAERGARVLIELDYELRRRGPLRAVADAVFIRRALRDSLRRTLGRFSAEAEDEAGLR